MSTQDVDGLYRMQLDLDEHGEPRYAMCGTMLVQHEVQRTFKTEQTWAVYLARVTLKGQKW